MRVAVVGNHRKYIEKELPSYGLELSRKKPDVVISYGGDGTILECERIYPGIPKVFIRHSHLCVKCQGGEYRKFLELLSKKKFEIVNEIKVEGMAKGEKLVGLNEINIVSTKPVFAARFDLILNGKVVAENVIGDGVLVATPYGSRAYFYSIARKSFKSGLGIAFNNPREKMENIFVKDTSVVKVKISRDGAWMIADNNPKFVSLSAGDVATIKKSKQVARIVKFRNQ